MRKKFIFFAVVVLLIVAGCQNEDKPVDNPVTIKVLAWNEQTFYQQYGTVFLATHPEIKLDVLSFLNFLKPGDVLDDILDKIVSQENPDVLMLPADLYNTYRDQNHLNSLSSYIKKDKFDLAEFAPAATEYLKDETGELFGLTPKFTGAALFYNKKLFEAYGIPLPTDSMTWDDTFLLAGRFPKLADNPTPVYGFYEKNVSNPFLLALEIGEGSGLTFFNNQSFTINSQAWVHVFQSVMDFVKTSAYFDNSKEGGNQESMKREDAQVRSHPFLSGHIAMAVDSSELYRTLQLEKESYPNLDWGLVPLPVSADSPDTGNGIDMNDIFTISANSEHKDASWELVKYVCSDNYASLLPHMDPYSLPVRKPSGDQLEVGLDAFYKLDHMINTMTGTLKELPQPVIAKMDEFSKTYLADVLADKISVSQALESMQDDLQRIWEQNSQ